MAALIKIVIPGKPIAQARPRFRTWKGKDGNARASAYSSQETEAGQAFLLIREQYRGAPISGPVCVDFRFCFPVPKSIKGKRRADMLSHGVPHTKKPDFDNLAKFYCDVLTGHVWVDDAQVVGSLIVKQYSDEPRTEIYVSELDAREISRLYHGRIASAWPATPDEF